MSTELDEVLQKLTEAKETYTKSVLSVLHLLAQRFFDLDPRIEAVGWRQYTPYFNDGDPCKFSIDGDLWFKIRSLEDSTDLLRVHQYYGDELPEIDPLNEIFESETTHSMERKFSDFICSNSEIMESAFGNNSMVWLHRNVDHAEVEQYVDHE